MWMLLGAVVLLTAVWFGVLRTVRRHVNERQRVESALKVSEDRLHMVVANAPIVLFAVDEAGIFILSEGKGLSVLGLAPGEVVGRSVFELYRDVPAVGDHIRRALGGDTFTAVVDVGTLTFESHFTPLRNERDAVIGAIGVATDMTASRRAEEDVRTLNQTLHQRLTELDAMNAELGRANRDLVRKDEENAMFIYSISHDLRSPLVNLQGFSNELNLVSRGLRSVLAEHDVPSAIQRRVIPMLDGAMAESIRFIQSGVARLSHIIDALLRLSRIGREEYQRQEVDVRSVVARVMDAMTGTISDRRVEVTVNDLPPTWGDHTAIERVFANLIGNALNYLDPERPGRLEIGSRPDPRDGCLAYYVRDNGRGIPEQSRPKVFQIFQRFHTDVPNGEGIGLAIVRRIVERHGGKVWFESEEGVGTTFLVTFPGRTGRTDVKRVA